MIIINNKASIFLTEIFNKTDDNKKLFNNFDKQLINHVIPTNYIINEKKNYFVSDLCYNIIWSDFFKINNIINFVDIKYNKNQIHVELNLLTNKSKKNQLITGYDYIISYIISNYIEYKILKNNNKIMTGLLNHIIFSNNSLNFLSKDITYEQKFKLYFKIDNKIDINKYINANKPFLNKYYEIIKKDNLAKFEFKFDHKSGRYYTYDKDFIDKCIKSYKNLINHNEEYLLNDILIYSINKAILKSKRFGLQHLNLKLFNKLINSVNITDKFVDIFNKNIFLNFTYTNIEIQKYLLYENENNDTIIGIADILLENEDEFIIIDIKAVHNKDPDINHLLQVLIYCCIYHLISKKRINTIIIYSAIYGIIYSWKVVINEASSKQFLNELLLIKKKIVSH